MTERVPVLVAAAGAEWETDALERIGKRSPAVVLQRRCVDLHDLLATAGTGLAAVAVVGGSLPGLDADSVASLRRAGVGVVLVATPAELEVEGERWRRFGIEHLVSTAGLDGLVNAIDGAASPSAVVASDGPVPAGEDHVQPGGGRLTAVWGPAGAPGRTTVAVGLAAELATRGRSTLLVDADPYAGAVAQHLGVLDEMSGLLAAARLANGGRLDREALARLARDVHGLRVLTGLPRADRWVEVRPAAFDQLLDVAADLVEHVVVDVGFSLEGTGDPFGTGAPARNQMTLGTLERADEVVVVGAADPVGLARLARGLVEVTDAAPDAQLRVVVNRCRPSLGWGEREIRGMVEGFVAPSGVHFLPEDRDGADRALMAGSSLVEAGDSMLGREIAGLAGALLGEPVQARRRALLRGRRQAPKSR
jgi:MinD-like ATPase involved in chromosome partitioning or flagellar assembly